MLQFSQEISKNWIAGQEIGTNWIFIESILNSDIIRFRTSLFHFNERRNDQRMKENNSRVRIIRFIGLFEFFSFIKICMKIN